MKSFKDYINEEANPDFEKIRDAAEKAFKKEFPNGWISSNIGRLIDSYSLVIDLGVVSDHSQLTSRIVRNDPVYHKFMITDEGKHFEARNLIGDISINPPEGSYLAMGRVKTKFRKTKGDADKIIKTFDVFFGRLKKLVKDNEANIYGRKEYSDKYFK